MHNVTGLNIDKVRGARILSSRKNRDEFNKEIVDTLQKIVHPKRLNRIYDRVINFQKSQQHLEHQKYVLGVIQEYIKEIDGFLQE